ncbi:hypothetical protein KIN20_011079 [Parelaphostrongylus tenuis]|uniref:Uncharacterized protein n=1 Tax=Parelaphostrongylus tenuis TaxID=148309 RepID=A0AAD5MT08_PARTN|nr:hypothetical protein KIN20_011079 [Parelaphostrongylus tenuis]
MGGAFRWHSKILMIDVANQLEATASEILYRLEIHLKEDTLKSKDQAICKAVSPEHSTRTLCSMWKNRGKVMEGGVCVK